MSSNIVPGTNLTQAQWQAQQQQEQTAKQTIQTQTPSTTLNQNQGGTLPTQSTQTFSPVPHDPLDPNNGAWQEIGTVTSEKTVPAHMYAPTGNSPYQTGTASVLTLGPVVNNQQQNNQQPNLPLTPAASEQYSDTTGFSKSTPQKGGIPAPSYFSYNNLTPQGQAAVRQGALNEALGIAAPIAFVVAPEAAVTGALLGPAISQGIKAVQGQGWLTPQEATQSIAGGAVFSVIGSGIIGGVGLAGAKGVLPALARVGINTGLGAGGGTVYEYAQTGKVTGQGAIQGAEFGAVFGVAGEAIGQGLPKLQERFQPKVQTNIDQSYMQAAQQNELWQPSIGEKLAMKVTNTRPSDLAPNIIESKTLPTTDPSNYESFIKPVTEQFQDNILINKITEQAKQPFNDLPHSTMDKLYPITLKNEIIDNIDFINERTVNKTFTQPKDLEPNSYKGLMESSLKKATLTNAEMFDPTSTFIGNSESPETYYAKIQKPISKQELSEFSFNGKDLTEKQFTPEKLSFNKANEPVNWKAMVPAKSMEATGPNKPDIGELSFKKPPVIQGLKGLKENINLFPKLSTEELTSLDYTGKNSTPVQNSKGFKNNFWQEQEAQDFLNKGGFTQPGKSKTYNPLIQELVSGQKAEPTGVTKVISDLQTGRTIQTARAQPIMKPQNPFATFSGRTYYNQRQTEETETIYLNTPNSGLTHPQQPAFITNINQKQQQTPFISQPNPNIFSGLQTSETTQLLKPKLEQINSPLTDIAQTQNPWQQVMPIQKQNYIPITIPLTKTTPINTTRPPTDIRPQITTPNFFPPIGAKGMEFGGNKYDNPFFGGIASRKREYPILTASEFWG